MRGERINPPTYPPYGGVNDGVKEKSETQTRETFSFSLAR